MTFLPSWASLKAYKPNGVLFMDYSADDDLKLVITDQTNGGFFDCTFELCNYYNRLPYGSGIDNTQGVFGYTIVVRDEVENFEMFRGLVQRPVIDAGNKASITAIGHGNPEGSCSFKRDWGDGNHTPTDGKQTWIAGTQVIDIIRDTLSMCQQIFEGDLADMGGIQINQETRDENGMAAYDIWQELTAMTAGFGTPLQWFVRSTVANPIPSLDTRFQDTAVRYRCNFDNDTVKVVDTYDENSVVNGATVRYGNGLRKTDPIVGTRNHQILATNNDRDKFIDVNNEIRGDADAQALATNFLGRFDTLRPTTGTVTLCGAAVIAEPPIVDAIAYPSGRSNYPIHMIQSGWTIKTIGLPSGQSPLNVEEHFITAVRYEFDNDTMTLTCNEIVGLGSTIKRVESYMTNLASIATQLASYSVPEYHAAATPIYGPQAEGDLGVANGIDQQIGTPIYTVDVNETLQDPDQQIYLPFKAGISPQTVPDYGTQANFGREADSTGIKGFVRLIPQKVVNWEIAFLPPPASDTIPTDSITVEFYDTYPFTPGSPFATKSVSAAQSASGTFSGATEQHVFAQGGKVGIRVSSAAGTTSAGFMVALGGRKLFPDLGVNT